MREIAAKRRDCSNVKISLRVMGRVGLVSLFRAGAVRVTPHFLYLLYVVCSNNRWNSNTKSDRHRDGRKSKSSNPRIQQNMKTLIAILSLFTLALTLPLQAAPDTEKSLYERLGGVFAIAAVVDHFSDAIVQNPIVGKDSKNPALKKWHTKNLDRLPGLKFMRTLWVSSATGGPFKYTPTKPGKTEMGLEEAHRDLKISPEEFDEVAAELGRSLDFAKVPAREKKEVLAAFAAHKNEVTAGYKSE